METSNCTELSAYQQRKLLLTEFGFDSYKAYLQSNVWSLIRAEVLYRDEGTCRRLNGCASSSALQAHHLAYSRAALLGVNLSVIVTLCKDCHTLCEFNKSAKRDAYGVRKKTLELVAGGTLKKGVSDANLGRWFDNQFRLNREHSRRLLTQFKLLNPDWYQLIVKNVHEGLLPEVFVDYLGLEGVKPARRYTKGKPLVSKEKLSEAAKVLEARINERNGKRKPLNGGGVKR